ncbi:MAG: hypothetical protein ACRC3H_04825 [Lachnospiraceae bacterium]
MNLIIQGINIIFIIGILLNAYRYSRSGFINNATSLSAIIIGFLLMPILTPLIRTLLIKYTGIYDFFLNYGEKLINVVIAEANSVEILQPFVHSVTSITSNSIANFIVKIISFIITVLIVKILLKIILSASKVGTSIVNRFSVTSMFNRVLGFIYGLVLQCVMLWVAFYILTLLSYFTTVNSLLAWILQLPIFNWLHEHNPLISLF